jgi:hypothetical protein
VDAGGDPNGVRTVGVLGVGTMGAGIVQLAAQTGHRVVACDLSVDALEKAQLYVRDGFSRFVGRGTFSEEEAEEYYDRIHWTVNLEDMAEVDAAIEAPGDQAAQVREATNPGEIFQPGPDGTLQFEHSSVASSLVYEPPVDEEQDVTALQFGNIGNFDNTAPPSDEGEYEEQDVTPLQFGNTANLNKRLDPNAPYDPANLPETGEVDQSFEATATGENNSGGDPQPVDGDHSGVSKVWTTNVDGDPAYTPPSPKLA